MNARGGTKVHTLGTTPYGFGETRVAKLALMTVTTPSSRACGVVMTKFSGHAVTFRSSPTVFADTPMLRSTSTRILSGKPPRAMWSAAVLLGLYRIRVFARYITSIQDWVVHHPINKVINHRSNRIDTTETLIERRLAGS
jgi:hypothetical protein